MTPTNSSACLSSLSSHLRAIESSHSLCHTHSPRLALLRSPTPTYRSTQSFGLHAPMLKDRSHVHATAPSDLLSSSQELLLLAPSRLPLAASRQILSVFLDDCYLSPILSNNLTMIRRSNSDRRRPRLCLYARKLALCAAASGCARLEQAVCA